jgi:uncharacterized membrane protein
LLVFVPLLGFGGLAVFSGDASQAQAVGVAFLLGALVFLALLLPLVMAIWFAPPLVVFNNLSAIDAMRLSFLGCLKNIVPFLIYGLLGAIIAFAATITLLLGWLVATPIFMASIYVSYREIFYTG